MRRVLAGVLALVASLVATVAAESPSPITFSDVTKRAGLKFKYETDLRHGRMIATMGGGVAMGDYDGDGWLDLFFTGSVANGKHPEKGPCGVLYRNRGDGTFEDTTAKAGLHACGWTMGASWVDVNSNGRLDLLVTGLGRTFLYENAGNGTFTEVSEKRGLRADRFAIGLSAGDVNGDGRVDLYVVNYLDTTYEKELAFPRLQVRFPEDYEGQDAFLFVQRPDGTFVERAGDAGVTNHGGKGLAALFFDFDGDGVADLYVSNDRAPNVLNKGRGDGTFVDVTAETGAGSRDQKTIRAGMGIAVGDVDGDARPDLLVTNFAGEPSTLYRNVEGRLFDDATDASGVAKITFPYVKWGTDFVDLDDDGRPDLVSASGHLVPRVLSTLAKILTRKGFEHYSAGDRAYKQPPQVLRNTGEGRFEDVTSASGDWALLRLAARGLAAGDVDGDGRVDVAIAAIAGGARLMKNTTARSGRVLEILPVAGPDHRTVLGTKVIVTANGRKQTQEFVLRPSYASGSWVPLHFGLGIAARAEKVEIVPPGETAPRFVLENVDGDRLYRLASGRLEVIRPIRR